MITKLLPLVTRPSRYWGGEVNSSCKDVRQAKLTFVLVFPDVYEVGMSHLGMQILYGVLNSQEGIVCERAFSPWFDMEDLLRCKNLPLYSLESHTPLRKFDVLGFSLQYELCYTNVLNILSLAEIPLLSKNRAEDMPWVIAGGPCAFNPEPLADFFDAFVLGDGEEVVLEVADVLSRWKDDRKGKDTALTELAGVKGVYVPSLFEIHHRSNGTIQRIEPRLDQYRRITKRTVSDLNDVYYPRTPIVPCMRVIHDRLSVEISRGCTRGCRFCQAGYIYRPVRERHPHLLMEIIDASLKRTGYDEISLLSLSAGDYTCLEPLMRTLMAKYEKSKVAVSLPSMRVGTLTKELMEEIKKVRKTGFTLAPEAATERMQKIINKCTDEGALLDAAAQAFTAGWNLIKLYFMIGLPYEREEDVRGIVDLAQKVSRQGRTGRRKAGVNVSISNFIPKPHTPFQWGAQLSLKEMQEWQRLIRQILREKGVRLKYHDARMSFLEGVFSRGDRRLGEVLLKAHQRRCRFDGWAEHLKWREWEEAFADAGVDPSFYVERERDPSGEILPWDHLSCGVAIGFLRDERRRASEAVVTPDCRDGECYTCGACEGPENMVMAESNALLPSAAVASQAVAHARPWPRKIRARFVKIGEARFIGHLDMVDVFIRAARRADIPVKFSEGFHPLPKVWFTNPLPLGTASLMEFVDFELVRHMRPEECKRRMNRELPLGLRIVDAYEMPVEGRPLAMGFEVDRFLISLQDVGRDFSDLELGGKLQRACREKELVLVQERKGKISRINALPYIEELRLVTRDTYSPSSPMRADISPLHEGFNGEVLIEMGLRREGRVRPVPILQRILHLSSEEAKLLRVVKTESLPPLL